MDWVNVATGQTRPAYYLAKVSIGTGCIISGQDRKHLCIQPTIILSGVGIGVVTSPFTSSDFQCDWTRKRAVFEWMVGILVRAGQGHVFAVKTPSAS